MKARPTDLQEDEVKAASAGKSETVLGKSKPLDLKEDEVKAASEGKSETIVGKKQT